MSKYSSIFFNPLDWWMKSSFNAFISIKIYNIESKLLYSIDRQLSLWIWSFLKSVNWPIIDDILVIITSTTEAILFKDRILLNLFTYLLIRHSVPRHSCPPSRKLDKPTDRWWKSFIFSKISNILIKLFHAFFDAFILQINSSSHRFVWSTIDEFKRNSKSLIWSELHERMTCFSKSLIFIGISNL